MHTVCTLKISTSRHSRKCQSGVDQTPMLSPFVVTSKGHLNVISLREYDQRWNLNPMQEEIRALVGGILTS